MKVLVIGSGGREHALCWALAASPLLTRLFCAPGNPGISGVAACVALDPLDLPAIVGFCRTERIDLVVIGPEAPLVAGLADALRAAGVRTFGPSAKAAMIEGSKGFMKDLCAAAGIPTAAYGRFSDLAAAETFIDRLGAPIVVKADGLAAGKGVVVAETVPAAKQAAREILDGRFGSAGASLVIEEFMVGEEASFFALVDGRNVLPFGAAQDHKRAFDGDRGPNTGGMGAYTPAPIVTPAMEREIVTRIVEPAVRALADAGAPFVGVLFAGLMITAEGPKLIEFNARFGDPECEVLMRRLGSDLLPALLAAAEGRLGQLDVQWRDEVAVTVVMAAEGYPDEPKKGGVIEGLDEAASVDGVVIFHSGTRADNGRIVANGGRVLNVTATGRTVREATQRAYAAIDRIRWPDGFCRRDIGWRAIEREAGGTD